MNEQQEYKGLAESLYAIDERKVARVYAEALLRLANERNQPQETLDALEEMVLIIGKQHPEFGEFFRDTTVGRERKAQAIRDALAPSGNELLTNFLLVINAHDRQNLLRAVALEYRILLDRQLNRVPVVARSAVELTDEQKQRLYKLLHDDLGQEPVIIYFVDPELLGGLMVRVGDFLYDGTVRTRLRTLQNQLVARSSHEILVDRDRFLTA